MPLLLGCGKDDEPGVLGSRSDVKTTPGVYDGYEIIDECQLPSNTYGILGTGSNWYSDVAPEGEGRADAVAEFATVLVRPALADVKSVGGVGLGSSCTLNAGATAIMNDWRDVDRAFARAGRLLLEHHLREEITLRVTSAQAD